MLLRGVKRLYERDRFRILQVSIADDIADNLFQWDRLDGIGPACFATIEELANAQVVEVSYET